MKIADNVYYVGVSNPTLRVFDIIMCTEYGTTYNSYLVKGADKTALIDGAHKGFEANFQENVEAITDFANIDYMVVNHTEPDHSGAIRLVIEKNPDIVVYGTAACLKNLDNIVRLPFNRVAVKDGDTLELGGKTLTFCVSPNIHWPDTMMTYLAEDKILFSCDFLGAHFAEPTMYVHKAYKKELYEKEFKVYYDAIMGPFAKFVIRALDRIKDLDIALVCPSHGPMIMGGDIQVAMDTYRKWATPEEKTDKTVAIYYVSAYGYTRQMCQYLAEKLEAKGLVVSAFDVIKTDAADIAAHLEDDCLVFGSPTLNRAALKPVLDVISSIDAVGAAGRPYATLGCFGWSGEACAQLNDRCNSIKMKQVGESVRSQFTPTDEVWAALDTLADQIAETVNK
ncbi:MAG: FprA family A-type flavoprotein [Peptococcaceae bacterium]|nr:FprA family A-type flavoprotein [Peptococcaceae bacterium]MEE0205412.1 FprA family A-type flavoprotein [Peptococcaceae bacterium]